MKVLVTGGAGFIGSHLVTRLVDEGYEVTVLDDFSTGRRENLAHVAGRIEVVDGDIRDRKAVDRAIRGADTVFHEAALGSVSRSVEDPETSNDVNVNGSLTVLVAARDAGVRRLVFASSSSVYGDTPTLPKHEEMPVNPFSPYAVTKMTAEYYFRVFHRVYGLETVSLRYFNVFGPRQDPKSLYAAVIPLFTMAMLRNESPRIFGDGEQSRDFTYIDNVVEANMLAMRSTGGIGEAMNIGAGGRYTLNDLVKRLRELTGSDAEPVYTDPRPGDIRDSYAAVGKAEQMIGYRPHVEFAEGLRRTVAWYLESLEEARVG